MSYPFGLLLRYGHSIEDAVEREVFLNAIQRIPESERQTTKGRIIVMAGVVRGALQKVSLGHLAADLAQNYIHFLEPQDLNNVERN